jgi:flagellar L-ring protein precursor FlgH
MKIKMNALNKAAFLCVASLTFVPAMAQTAAPNAARSRAEGASGQPQPANNNAAVNAGIIMQRTGSSLLQAQLSAQADPAQAKMSAISFFAVPEPQPKTMKKHDLITIIIREESDIQSKGSTDMKKNAELQAQVNQMVKLKLSSMSLFGLPTPAVQPGVDLTGARTFHGEGEVDRTDSMTARITAEIIDVKPNGTLVLQARKHIKTDDEEQSFVLSGTCRVEDVTADNSILSTQLHDLDLQKNHSGAVRDSTKRGVLPKLLDFVNPF